jgi:multiple sugar transport system substrate-binding protein
VVCKTSAFEKAGIKVPDQMWTWEQLAQTATDLSKAHGRRFWGVEDGGGNYIPCDLFLRGMGKGLFTPERQLGFENKDLAEWFAYWDRLRKAGGTPPGDIQALATGDDLSRTGIIAGRSAMLFQLTDAYVGLQALTKDELTLHMVPNGFEGSTLKQHHYTYAGNSTGVWSKTPHVDRIIDIIRYMHFDPEGVELYYRDSGMVPASKAGRVALAKEGSDSDRRVLAYIDLIQQEETPPRNPGITGMSGMLRRMNEAVAFSKLKPQEAADQFVAEAHKRLKT